MWKLAFFGLTILLVACGGGSGSNPGVTEPAVSSFYGGTPGEAVQVQVQITPTADPMTAHARTQLTANRVCARRNQRAEYTHRREMMNRNWEDVYMCR
ncbi:hypothetical protein C8N43_2424 [Litoreibacter ponti]|uniref:Lipoprotein n=1 Tax=Litoreibacter ponti TaxID=1510457 RepID=A0A2T6BNU2_9RHOB|nr:hypothetical protein [Litoreibacter ponti]PTX57753.1 hypothetical protein C8N43_2424 [Litoreibacter ponti]